MIYHHILVVWFCCFISTDAFSTFHQMVSDEHKQMNYIPTGPLLAQFIIKSKLLCAAQCTRLYPTCNIAVFDSSINSQCSLYNELLTPANLVPLANAIVFDFRRNYTNEITSTQETVTSSFTTQGPTFIANTYGSINDTGVNDNHNSYIIFNTNQAVTLAGFVSNVSIKFCTLPTSASPVLWIYIVKYTGTTNFYVTRAMYAVPYNQISTTNPMQQYILPQFQFNISAAEYVGIGFGKTTGGSPCQVTLGNSSYTNAYGGANQTYLVSTLGSWSYNFQSHGVAISYTVLTLV